MLITLAVLCLGLANFEAPAQAPPRLLYTIGADGQLVFADVRAVGLDAGTLAFISQPDPAVHLRDAAGHVTEWGRKGQGPGELIDPVDIALTKESALVLDMGNRRLDAYTRAGRTVWSRSLETTWANHVAVIGTDTLLHTLVPMTSERAVVRLHESARDTVLRYNLTSDVIELVAQGSPRMTVTRPFVAQSQWAPIPNVGYAYWSAGQSTIGVFDAAGHLRAQHRVPPGSFAVAPADREHWFQTAIPQEFMGRHVFEPVLQVARRTVEFPTRFPLLLALLGSTEGGVWVRRTESGGGEVWMQVDGGSVTFRLPPGRQLLAIDARTLVARAQSANDEPVVEVYERPTR